MIEEAVEKGAHTFEWMHKKKNGPEFLAKVFLVKVEIFGNVFLQAVVTDITKQKESQKEKIRSLKTKS